MTDLERLKSEKDVAHATWNAAWVAYDVAHATWDAARDAYDTALAAQTKEQDA